MGLTVLVVGGWQGQGRRNYVDGHRKALADSLGAGELEALLIVDDLLVLFIELRP